MIANARWCTAGVWHLCTSLPPSVPCCDLSLSLFTLPRPCDVYVETLDAHIQLVQLLTCAEFAQMSADIQHSLPVFSASAISGSEASMTIDKNMMAKNGMMPDEEQQQSVDGCWWCHECHEDTGSLCSMKISRAIISNSDKECVLLNMKFTLHFSVW